ncbi:hypothetical protein [Planctomyces sp. SH-PL62]|uniref:hypothetical protein n=1 Tax=Planctomyces sp. SH-PL62 TaxID=1636152 RepID=UPI00078B1C4E|nr:hypothetical protein [Planctomyces sp. SH-PL62]AMV38671.1 ribonuclease HII [Planctomyces sp. SH-PL62]
MRWVGIDEAGYGPNLGPLVMTAVVVESLRPDDGPTPDLDPPASLWDDLAATVRRVGKGKGDDRLLVDDSKAILKGGRGRERLLSSAFALLDAGGRPLPGSPAGLVASLADRDPTEAEIERWLGLDETEPPWPAVDLIDRLRLRLAARPFAPPSGAWRVAEVHVEIVGPERFNEGLSRHASKAAVHFEAFARLLRAVWECAADGRPTRVRGDKHGGRHFYREPLLAALPDAWIDRGAEGPALSEYTIRAPGREVNLRLTPRADAEDALVALASIVGKAVRECWMDVFNAFWARRVPGLKPSAGYPVDASRFRRDVEPTAIALGIEPRLWWRAR